MDSKFSSACIPPSFLKLLALYEAITSVNRGYVHKAPPIVEAAGVYIVRVVAVVGGLLCMFRVADLVALAVKGGEEDVISNCGPRGFSVIYLYSQYCRFYFYEQNFFLKM